MYVTIDLQTMEFEIHLNRSHLKNVFPEKAVMLAKAGIQKSLKTLDSRLHGNDKAKQDNKKFVFEIASI